MVLEHEFEVRERMAAAPPAGGWYRSSERAKHPHTKKLRVECSLDEDVIQWLQGKTQEDEEYQMYINHYLKRAMAAGL
ncbi:MAG: BrnA antitoxin family protein [Chitinispirillia bacterium]|nr:BrnA antitoxin family protein [Chitinispirillia bacterium]MCL2269142.1 BrnA antitoxin family protein [Chitinispirillia bacterium]